jgi:hypothetical protein
MEFAMAERYFLKRGKTVKGPFSIKKLQELLAAQKLKANDLLAIHKDGPWERMAAVHKKLRAGTELIESQQPVDASTVSVSNNLISCTDCGTQVSKQAITCPNCGAPIGDADVSKESDDDYGDDDYGDEDYPDSEYEEYIPKHRTPKPKQQSKNRKRNTKNRTSSESGMPVFVLAIVGVVLIPICLPIAWAMGAAYARRCNDAHTTPDSFGHIGRLIGKLFTYVWVLAIALGMVFLLRMLSMLASPNDVANNEVSTNEVSNNETKEDAQDAMDTDDHSPQIDYDQTKLNAKLNTLKIKVRLKFIRKHQLDAAFYQFYVAEGGDVEWNKAKGTLNATIAIESRKKEMRGAQIYLYFTQSDDTGGFFDYWTLQSFDTSEVALKEYYRQHVAGKLLKCLITGEKM